MAKFHPGEYLDDELKERGWTTRDCAERMGGAVEVDTLALDLLIACAHAPEGHAAGRVRLGQRTADGLARAFGQSAQTWMNLDAAYHAPDATSEASK